VTCQHWENDSGIRQSARRRCCIPLRPGRTLRRGAARADADSSAGRVGGGSMEAGWIVPA